MAAALETLTFLYDQYGVGNLDSTDRRWQRVNDIIVDFTKNEVTRISKDLYGPPLEAAVDVVTREILAKFISKRLNRQLGQATIEPLLRFAIRNDLMSHFRRSRSPSTVTHEANHGTGVMLMGGSMSPDRDVFHNTRQHFGEFRFPEWSMVREAILAFFLTRMKYPGHRFLNLFGVNTRDRVAVYNAALFDINRAMIAHCT